MLGAAFSRLPPSFPNGLQVLLLAPEPATRTEISGQLAELAYKATRGPAEPSHAPAYQRFHMTEPAPGQPVSIQKRLQKVDAFATAREAAAFLSTDQNAGKLDIILAEASSVHVGDTDSEWLLRHAKAAHLPLVLMSGSGSQGEVMKGIELGAVDYLEKPVSLQKLRNIWQHVVRKMMLSGGVPEDQKPCCSMKVEAPAALPPAKAVAAASGPSPAASGEEPVHSTHTGHSSKCSEAEASSCSEMTNLRRCLRSADTSAESSGKQQQATSGETAAGPLRCATSTSAPRTRPKRTLREAKRQPPAAKIAASDPPAILPVPSAAWQTVPGCGWGTPTVPMNWQMGGMPGAFMPVSSSPLLAISGATDASLSPKKRKSPPAAGEAPPATLPSMGSFASCMSCTLELDLNALGSAPADLASPSFATSDDSLSSDFTELMLPDDLDLDAMFGDGLDAPMGADCCGLPPLAGDKPPIGLSLRKSQSFVNLINATLAATTSSSACATMKCGA